MRKIIITPLGFTLYPLMRRVKQKSPSVKEILL